MDRLKLCHGQHKINRHFQCIKTEERRYDWTEDRKRRQKKVEHLTEKYDGKRHSEEVLKIMKNIKTADRDIEKKPVDSNYVTFGNVDLSADEAEYINYPAKYRLISNADVETMSTETEKLCTKLRYGLRQAESNTK